MKKIPIKGAKEFAEKYGQDQVIIMSFEKTTGLTHVVTYGKTIDDCDQAADGGNKLKREFLKWPYDLCKDSPSRIKRRNQKIIANLVNCPEGIAKHRGNNVWVSGPVATCSDCMGTGSRMHPHNGDDIDCSCLKYTWIEGYMESLKP